MPGTRARPGPARTQVAAAGTGDLRGPQAELAEAAEKAALEVAAVLDTVEPLRAAEAQRVRTLLDELARTLADELTRPRSAASEVERLLTALLGTARQSGRVGGALGRLEDELPVDRRREGRARGDLAADEEAAARAQRLADAVLTLRRRWDLYFDWLAEGHGSAALLLPTAGSDAARRARRGTWTTGGSGSSSGASTSGEAED